MDEKIRQILGMPYTREIAQDLIELASRVLEHTPYRAICDQASHVLHNLTHGRDISYPAGVLAIRLEAVGVVFVAAGCLCWHAGKEQIPGEPDGTTIDAWKVLRTNGETYGFSAHGSHRARTVVTRNVG